MGLGGKKGIADYCPLPPLFPPQNHHHFLYEMVVEIRRNVAGCLGWVVQWAWECNAIVHPVSSETGPRQFPVSLFGYHQGKISFLEKPWNPALMQLCFSGGLGQQHQTHILQPLHPTTYQRNQLIFFIS